MKYREEVEQLTLGEEGKRRVSAAVAQGPERPRPRIFRRVLAAALSLILVLSIALPSVFFGLKGSGRVDGDTGSVDSPSDGDANPNSPDGPIISDGPDESGEGETSDGELPSGQFYTMEEAYENGWITKEDIMEACYRRFGSVYECSAENPEESVEVDYTSPYPDPVLDKNTEKAIIHAYHIETKGQEDGISESMDYTLHYYGEFHDSYILQVEVKGTLYPTEVVRMRLAGIEWIYTEEPDFIVFRFDE